ncbi:MAG: hypothetical protein EOP48_18055 [Sphingobacteriales bacterium]|nr:MAG: hypothetical protein EOP48_18055 [Sphingobacteriales bacterium]
MQIFLLLLIIILSIILYRLLSSNKVTFPYIRTTRLNRTEDNTEYMATESEHGLITIDQDILIVEGEEYSLKPKKDLPAEAYLIINSGRLISVCLRLEDGEKHYFIDPEHNLYTSNQQAAYSDGTSPLMVSI